MSEHDEIARGSERDDLIRARQRSRARVLAIILGAFVVLVFAISIAKIQLQIGKPKVEDPSQMRSPSNAGEMHH